MSPVPARSLASIDRQRVGEAGDPAIERAADLSNYSAVASAMASQGWAHDVPGDDVHFDHTARTC